VNVEQGEDNNLVQGEPQMQEDEQSSEDSSSGTLLDENSNDTGEAVDLPIAQ
jgi:hypothetical protein